MSTSRSQGTRASHKQPNRQALKAWKTIVVVKERALARAEETLTARRRDLAERTQAVTEAETKRQEEIDRRTMAKDALALLLQTMDGLQPSDYILHKAYLKFLDEMVQLADKAVEIALRYQVSARQKVDTAQRDVTRAETSLDACRSNQQALLDAQARANEALADEEAGETAAARMHRARMATAHA